MNTDYQSVLKNAGIRPSIQRIAIYEYLCLHRTHPDVEAIYDDLNPVYQTLSKTTIYNTLQLFAEKNLIQTIKIDSDKVRFDAETKDHLHFKCVNCEKIFDIFEGNSVSKIFGDCKKLLPSGFQMAKIETDIWGICPQCSAKAAL